jgi:hypothetical protein
MIRRKLLWGGGVLGVAFSLLCTATIARADLIITVGEDGATPTTIVDEVGSPTSNLFGGVISFSTTDYSIVFLSGEANQNSITELLSSDTSVTRNATTGSHVLNITITGTGYTSPNTPPPVDVNSHLGATVATGSAGDTMVYHSLVGATDIGAQTLSIGSAGSYNNSKSAVLTTLTGTFQIQQTLNITLNKSGDTTNYSTSTTLTQATATPAPAGIVLALSGLPFLGIGTWFRHRKAKVVG